MVVLTVVYPGLREIEISIGADAPMSRLAVELRKHAPAELKKRADLLKTHTPVRINADGRHTVLRLDTEAHVSEVLNNDDTIELAEGAPPPPSNKKHHAVQVVSFGDGTIDVKEDLLRSVLDVYGVRNLPVSVVSVAGPFRTGKSLLLNFLLRYLEDPDDWEDVADAANTGFHWAHGVERDTSGIWMYSKPFVCTLPDGTRIAVVLVDTQGTFDRMTTLQENTRIFAFNALVSSLQIYNFKDRLDDNILDRMHYFSTIGACVHSQEGGADIKPFQQLIFLVRDWGYEDPGLGEEGGRRYIREYLDDTDPNIPEQLQNVRIFLKRSYEDISGYLMPHPGKHVQRKEFQGALKELDEDFQKALREFVRLTMSPEKLVIKRVFGQALTGKDLVEFFLREAEKFAHADLPDERNMAEMYADVQKEAIRKELQEYYKQQMDNLAGPGKPHVALALLQRRHNETKDEVLKRLERRTLLGPGERQMQSLRSDIVKHLEDAFKRYEENNDGRDLWKGMRTPIVLTGAAFALNLIGNIIDFIDIIDPVATLLFYAAAACFLLIAAWFYVSATGNYPEQAQQLNSVVDKIWSSVSKHGAQALAEGAVAASTVQPAAANTLQPAAATAGTQARATSPGLRRRLPTPGTRPAAAT